MGIPKREQDTTISRSGDEDVYTIHTSIPADIKRFTAMGVGTAQTIAPGCWVFKIPASSLRISLKRKLALSEEARAKKAQAFSRSQHAKEEE